MSRREPLSGGMGLDNNKKARKINQDDVRQVQQGAQDVQEGVTQAGQGVAKAKSGNLVGGGKDIIQGANQAGQGAERLQNVKNDEPTPNRKIPKKKRKLQPNNESSDIEDELSKEMNDDSDLDGGDDVDSDERIDGEGDGIQDLLKDTSDESSADENKDSDSEDDQTPTDDLKNVKKGAKTTIAGAQAYSGYMAVQAFMRFIQFLQMMWAKGLAVISGLSASLAAMAKAAIAWVASVTGLSAVASAVVSAVTIVATSVTLVVGVFSSGDDVEKFDDIVCVPNNTSVSASVGEWESSGSQSAMYLENLNKSWSFMSEMGVEQTPFSGIMGNFAAESGLDPTGVETIYNEPYSIGPRKAKAEQNGFEMSIMDPSYQARFPGVKQAGIGLGQWSNGRNKTLRDYASGRGLDWFDIGVQLAFMFEGDNPSDRDILMDIATDTSLSIDEATEQFMLRWERPSSDAYNLQKRKESAAGVHIAIQTMEVDTDYAQSIISQMNVDVAQGNHYGSSYLQDDGCGGEVGDHYQGSVDGTGVFPPNITPIPWSPDTLPKELKSFVKDPGLVLGYGSSNGWINTSQPGQCVAYAHSFMERLYGVTAPRGVNGADVARAWYEAHHETLGGELNQIPVAGAIFSHDNGGVYGHTGVVDHVFANGDILVSEQNVRGVSGDNNGTPRTWGWRYFPAKVYQENDPANRTYNWEFYKPDREPMWTGAPSL